MLKHTPFKLYTNYFNESIYWLTTDRFDDSFNDWFADACWAIEHIRKLEEAYNKDGIKTTMVENNGVIQIITVR
jgi:D-mannonate dehydratase